MTIPEMELAHGVKRCAIYIRVSTAMQRIQGWSLQAQAESLGNFAKARGWKVVGIYADEGKSARKRLKGRKEIWRLMADVERGDVDVILFKEIDRWTRNVSDFYKLQDILDAHGVKWVSERQPHLGMDTKEDRLQVNLLLSVGQNETDSTSDRIIYTNKFLREQKRWTSGPRTLPRGYMLDEEKHVHIDPEQEPFVRALIDNFYKYGTIQTAMTKTNEEYPPGMFYNNVVRLLRNPMLYGHYKGVDDFVEKPYMTKKEWDRLQSLMTRNARAKQTEFYIFSGMMRCANCGTNLAGTHTIRCGKQYKYYRCAYTKTQGRCDSRKSMREEKTEEKLIEFIKNSIADKIAHVNKITHERKTKKPKKGNRDKIEKQLKKLKNLYIEDEMTWEEYQQKKAAITEKLIPDEPEEKLPDLADLEAVKALFEGDVADLYDTFTLEERREFWRGIVSEIKCYNGEIVDVEFIE